MRHLHICLTSLLFLLLAAGLAYAAGEEHESPRWTDLLYRTVTIALVIAAVWKLAGKKIAGFFTGRREGIAQELNDLEKRKEAAREELLAIEKRIAGLERERLAILADYETRGEALKAEIIARAESAAAQIMAQATRTAQSEIDNALAAMRSELADRIGKAAGESLAKSLTTNDQEKLINAFLNKVVLQ
ncbi:ATP synthase subunit b [Deltaproteobacteria bacterium]|nr:ATP synthase subunit b [Deltaproteobacteria bacterium]